MTSGTVINPVVSERASRRARATSSDMARSRYARRCRWGGKILCTFLRISPTRRLQVVCVIAWCTLHPCLPFLHRCLFLSLHWCTRSLTYIFHNDWGEVATLWMLAVKETYGPSPMSSTSSANLTSSLLDWPLFFVVFIGNLWRGLRMSCSLPYAPPSLCTATLTHLRRHRSWNRVATTHSTLRSAFTLFHLLLGIDFDTPSIRSTPAVVYSFRENNLVRASFNW
jgi:hypothetical protein